VSTTSEPNALYAPDLSTAEPTEKPNLLKLLWIWFAIGAQSFGGGSATLFMVRRAITEQHKWMSEEEFMRNWAMCQIAPGVNLLSMTVLTGWRLAGIPGIIVSIFGMLFPSISITILITIFYATVSEYPLIEAALKGIVPATVGISFLLNLRLIKPILKQSKTEGSFSVYLSIVTLLLCTSGFAYFRPPVLVLLWTTGCILAAIAWVRYKRAARSAS
jgi:chromate transporter